MRKERKYSSFQMVLCLVVVLPINIVAQTITLTGQKTFGGSGRDFVADCILMENGNLVTVGFSNSDFSGDISQNNNGIGDFLILTLSEELTELDHFLFGGMEGDAAAAVLNTTDGGLLVFGSSSSPVSGDKIAPLKGASDYWVVKFDNAGNQLWQETYGGDSTEAIVDAIETANGDFLLFGYSLSDISGDKTEPPKGSGRDYWLVRINSSGNLLWEKTYGGDEPDNPASVSALADGGILLSGVSASNISGDKSEDNYGVQNVWLLRLDAMGNILWDKTLGGNAAENDGVAIYSNDAIYVVANSSSPVSGTKTQPSRGLVDMWLTKLDLDGNIIWDKAYGGSLGDASVGISVTGDNELMLTGFSFSNTSGEKTEDSYGMADMWLVAIDTNGTVLWDKGIGGSLSETATQTIMVDEGRYIVAGYSESGISGDKTESNRGEEDFWIVEIATSVGVTENQALELSMYPNPADEQLQIEWEKVTPSCQGVIEIHHTDGSLVQRLDTYRTLTTVPTGHLSDGLYMVTLTDCNGNRATEQLVRLKR